MNALPAPVPSELTAPYWDGAARGVLVLQRCSECRRFVHFPEYRCPFCRCVVLAFEPVEPFGVITARTVVHRPLVPGGSPPYTLAWAELVAQAGLRVFGAVVEDEAEDPGAPTPEVGDPVEVVFRPRSGFGRVPVLRSALPSGLSVLR